MESFMHSMIFFIFLGLVSGRYQTQCTNNSFATSANDFGFELNRQIGGQDNLFTSPTSIFIAMALVYLGARSETSNQIANALQLSTNGLNDQQLKEGIHQYLEAVTNGNDKYDLRFANGIFVQDNTDLQQQYREDAENFFQAAVRLVDFMSNGEEVKNEINSWVEDKTGNMIQNFFESPLPPTTVMALLSAIYFKGIWISKFDEEFSLSSTFYKTNGEVKKVTFMNQRMTSYYYTELNGYKFLELPYKGNHIKMLLALPSNSTEEPKLDMTSSLLCQVNTSLTNTKLDLISLPKFKLEYKTDLKEQLSKMGMVNLFTPSADLTGISKDDNLVVSKVQHAAVIEVNEEGSRAAATTGSLVIRLSLIDFEDNPEFIANHPFLFYITDRRNGLVLFSGRVSDP